MVLRNEQVALLMQFIASVTPDTLNCDGCLEHVPELAESQLGEKPLTDVLEKVQNHLDNCPCCGAEYKSFLEAIKTTDIVESS